MARVRASAAVGLLFAAEAHAQEGTGQRIVGDLGRCRAIMVAEARLDCFDTAAAALDAAVKAQEVRVIDRQDVSKARRSLFGYTIPKFGLFGGGREEEFTEINTTLASARPLANGRMELRLAEGDAVWSTTDHLAFPPKAGRKVRIRKGALGNYFINIDGERTVRGMRLR